MVCTTFLHESELNQQLPDPDIQNLLEEVRKKSGENIQVVKVPTEKSFFNCKKPDYYGLYFYVGGIGPWQQVHFFTTETKTKGALYVSLDVIAAYLYGLWSGLEKVRS